MAAFLRILELNAAQNLRKQRVFRDRTSQMDSLSDAELYSRYRMPRHAILTILDRIRPQIEHDTKRSKALSPESQVLITLRYLSKGGFLMEIGDLHGVSESCVSRSFQRCLDALCSSLTPITFPDAGALPKIQHDFYSIAGFPRVIGAIDGTIIAIKRPCEDEAAFVCRKGFHAVNVQAVCDASLRFHNAVVKWPGSCHDAFILSNSLLGEALEDGQYDGWLLGDSGYGCRPWLLTPVQEPATRGEERYNRAHIKTRNTIERAFGVLKSRFRCLHKSTGCLQFTPVKCSRIILACFLLHNFCLDLNLPNPDVIEEDLDPDYPGLDLTALHDGNQIRQNLIDNVFS